MFCTIHCSRLQQNRIRGALRAVDPTGTVLRGLEVNTIPRRPYSVPAPLSLWHIDGNHKLTRWRIVIHGGTDGFSRKIMYLAATDNNRASTVLTCFMQAVQCFGLPQRVRSDQGMENVDVARINMHLDMFMHSWERHPLSSEGNRSPEQLWIAGQLLNQTPDDVQIKNDNFGIDWEGPVGAADPEPGVTVPEAPPALKDVIEAKLRETIDPLKQSNSFGMDLYIEALRQAQFCNSV
ncbi:hypothetical protein DPEC_G00001110 [Dallia pectoralis]|uniref:Uncharacterized protein n=1 Tax=Dallia pectoralis TaxID=75939 RepID=A0ACC2HIP7_DALPE|nr:hypothetical protein DPEC_G00001110 [Dallia pectoralis]